MMIGTVIASKIKKIRQENKILKSFYLEPMEKMIKPKPGQFLMVWVPGLEEIPISVSGYFNGQIRISVAKRGETTSYMHSLKVGDFLGLKGPLGNFISPDSSKKYLLIGGGYGIAPLIFFIQEYKKVGGNEVDIIIGARSRELLAFENELIEMGTNVHVSTDDGSKGFHGTAIALMKRIVKRRKFDEVILCGPEKMLIYGSKEAIRAGIKAWVLAEEYMKCGIGICGSCELGNSGLLVCRDGPVFDALTYLRSLGVKY